MRGAVLLLLAMLFGAGCLAPAPSVEGERMFSGAFTREATQADLDELHRLTRSEGWDLLVLESFPMQYQARGDGEGACGRLRAAFQQEAYVASVGECREVTRSAEPDAPTSSG